MSLLPFPLLPWVQSANKPLQRWLFWTACFYPIFIAAQIWVRVLPAAARHWLLGERMTQVRLDPYFVMAAGQRPPSNISFTPDQIIQTGVLLLAFPILFWLRRRSASLAGLALASVGLIPLGAWLTSVLFRHSVPSRGTIPAMIGVFFVVAGLRWAAATVPGGYWARVGFTLSAFALPAAVLAYLARGFRPSWFVLLPPAIVLLLALLGLRRLTPTPAEVRGRSFVAGVLATALILTAILQGRQWQERRHESELARLRATLPRPAPDAPFPKLYFHRGVTFTANGYSYESEQARSLLVQLPAFGIQAVAVAPFGGIDRQTLRISTARSRSWEADAGVELITAVAHQRGMKVMLKPHIWNPQGISFHTAERRELWFREYLRFIEHYAQLAQRIHADIFCIGVEFETLTEFEQPWREIIARVREIYKGPLVYAANHGKEFESIRFWDALDYIGLDNYYPLPDDYSTADLVRRVETVAKRYDRPVLFTEAGYSAAIEAHRTPWEDRPPRAISLEEQVRCYEALMSAFYQQPWFAGVYWWKIETDGTGGAYDNSMVPWGKPAMETIRKWYTTPRHDLPAE
jgi:hypothetical protein